MSRFSSPLLRRLAFAVGAIFLAALVGAQVHRAYALHAVCAQHGELVHVESSSGEHDWHDGPSRIAGDAALDEEHGCSALVFLGTPIGPQTDRHEPERTRCDVSRAAPGAHFSPARPIPLLHQAPKLAPPLALV